MESPSHLHWERAGAILSTETGLTALTKYLWLPLGEIIVGGSQQHDRGT